MSSDTLCATGKQPFSFRLVVIRPDRLGMPDFSSGDFSLFASALSIAAFFLVEVVLVFDFLPATSGVDVFCEVDFCASGKAPISFCARSI